MNYAELIKEAEKRADQIVRFAWMAEHDADREEIREYAAQFRRLAAVLRELAPPEGWVATEYVKGERYSLIYPRVSQINTGAWLLDGRGNEDFPTASAAMAALDGESK